MSDGVLANMSAFARRKAMSTLSYLAGRLLPIVTVAPELLASVASKETFFVAVLGEENYGFFIGGSVSGPSSSSSVG
jgi:hypothetical protein